MKYTLIISLFFYSLFSSAQTTQRVWVAFKDKAGSEYSVDRPEEFLSQRALDRRAKSGIEIDESDLPVSSTYISMLKLLDFDVHYTSKWMNGAMLNVRKNRIDTLNNLNFITEVKAVGTYKPPRLYRTPKVIDRKSDYPVKASEYGNAEKQIKQINGDWLHKIGFKGNGKIVAVLDGGFTNVNVMPFFDSLRVNGRLLPGWDFVDNDDYPYEASSHGTQVLSAMAANLPGLMVGTAPEATYVCLRTEEVGSEMPVEEYNWVAGAEFADSLGADVINSSLGYTTYDDPQLSHTYKDMDGNTAVVTRGADMAASKGILVVNSAGNSGDEEWKYIGAPADGDDVFSIGAIDKYGNRTFFSSLGPTKDGRIKPNVVARGSSTVVASLYGYHTNYADGTSFSSPVIAGMATSLWQAFPDKTNKEIMRAIEKSGSNLDKPNNRTGYGIPDFEEAYSILSQPSIAFKPDSAASDSAQNLGETINGIEDGEMSLNKESSIGKEISNTRSFFNGVKELVEKSRSARP